MYGTARCNPGEDAVRALTPGARGIQAPASTHSSEPAPHLSPHRTTMSAAEHCKGSGAANAFDKYNAKKTGIATGLAKGHVVSKHTAKRRTRSRSAKKTASVRATRELIREVVGLSPYEKRILDVLKNGAGNVEKKMYKMSKQRLGSHRRAIKKRDEITAYWAKLRQQAA